MKEGESHAEVPASLPPSITTSSLNASGMPDSDAWRDALQEHEGELTALSSFLRQGVAGRRREWWLDVERVSQLDALRLDGEMRALLREQLRRMLALVPPRLLSRYDAELELLLDALLWRFSVWLGRSTPACSLLNLRFRDEAAVTALLRSGALQVRTGLEGPGLSTPQKFAYLFFTAGARYASTRLTPLLFALRAQQQQQQQQQHSDSLHGHLPHQDRHSQQRPPLLLRLLTSCLPAASSALSLASLFNLLLFLRYGRYRTLAERCLGIRAVYARPHMNRAIAFDYMNRQLVWTELSEFLLLILPLLNASFFSQLRSAFTKASPQSGQDEEQTDSCPICSTSPLLMPFKASPCGHIFCYYCIRTRAAAKRNYACPTCRKNVVTISRVVHEVDSLESQH